MRQSGQKTDIGVNLFIKMVEEKVEQLKANFDASNTNTATQSSENSMSSFQTPCRIDLTIDIALPDELFASSLDKINFYREIETIQNLEDLELISSDFKNYSQGSVQQFFQLLEAKIL
jgi:transcription-repair coupling factor (superfamily II helicase)